MQSKMYSKQQHEKGIVSFTWHFIKKYKLAFWALFLISILAALDEVVTPHMMDQVFQNIQGFFEGKNIYKHIQWSLYKMILLWVMFDTIYRISGLLSIYLYPLIEADVRMYMFNEVQHYRPNFFNQEAAEGVVENSVADAADGVHEIVEFVVSTLSPTTFAILLNVISICKRNLFIGLIVISWVFVHIGINVLLLRNSISCSSEFQKAQNTLAGKIVDSLLNRNITLQNNTQKQEASYINNYQNMEIKAHRNLLLFNEKIKFILSGASILTSAVLFSKIFELLVSKKITMSDGFYLFNVLFILVRSVWSIGTQLGPFVEALGQCGQGLSILDKNHRLYNNKAIQKFAPTSYDIEFRNVTVYDRGQCLIKNISFKINEGERAVLLGHSGSGKTTILRTLLGLTQRYEGEIFIGGINLKTVNMNEVRDIIGVLDQKSYVFNRSLSDNIKITDHNATLQDLKRVSEAAKLYNFVESLPKGFEEEVNINKFSGGQLQKICFARFFLKQGKILLFDELSTGLDILAQKEIINYIKNLDNVTCLFVDHNLTYLNMFDKIILINSGEIVGQGSHEELIKSNLTYQQMLNATNA